MAGEALAIFMGGAKTFAGIMTANSQAAALRKQALQERLKADQDALQRTNRMKQLFGTTEAMAGARGFSVASPSFKAIEREDFNQYADEQHIADLNTQFQQDAIRQQRQNIDNQAFIGAGTNLFDLGQMATRGSNPLSGTAQTTQNKAAQGSMFSWWTYPGEETNQNDNNYLW